MESAKKVSEYYQNEKLDKATKKVIDALANEPFGLQISQLMTVCQLSNKTVREALDQIKAHHEDGSWYLPKDFKTQPDKPQTLDDLGAKTIVVKKRTQQEPQEPEPVKAPIQASTKKTPLGSRTDEEIKQTPLQRDRCTAVIIQWERLGLQKMMELSGADEMELMREANSLASRAMHEHVRNTADAFLKILAADEPAKTAPVESETLPVEPKTLPVEPEKQPEPVKNLPPAEETLPPAEKQSFSLESCKQMVTTVVTKRSELTLDIDQLNDVLKQAFGLEEISWKIQANKILSVTLLKTETMEQ